MMAWGLISLTAGITLLERPGCTFLYLCGHACFPNNHAAFFILYSFPFSSPHTAIGIPAPIPLQIIKKQDYVK